MTGLGAPAQRAVGGLVVLGPGPGLGPGRARSPLVQVLLDDPELYSQEHRRRRALRSYIVRASSFIARDSVISSALII